MDIPSDDLEEPSTSSLIFKSILSGRVSEKEFFDTIWQKQPKIFPVANNNSSQQNSDRQSCGDWDDDGMRISPFDKIVQQGWHALVDLLGRYTDMDDGSGSTMTPLIFQNREPQDPDTIRELYGTSLFNPYLDGCSIVLNHADLQSPWIAALCLDLQRSFPHAYANSYLTPPRCQAVPAHADDRDVLIIQLVGSKVWKVYEQVPIPYPYPDEQVGKAGLPIPQAVLDGPVSLSVTLTPGDVLYMPRGFVHKARCQDELSFHVTVALATHDWTLAGIMSTATRKILTRVVDFRQSILPANAKPGVLQASVDVALDMLKKEITAETIMANLHSKLEIHNQRAFTSRMKQIHSARFPPADPETSQPEVVGPKAASRISLSSILRPATKEERAIADRLSDSIPEQRGLNARPETADAIMSIVGSFKADPNLHCKVSEMKLLDPASKDNSLICDLTLLCLGKRCVEVGALAVVHSTRSICQRPLACRSQQ